MVSSHELTESFLRPPFHPAFPNKNCLAMSLNNKIYRTANAPTTAPDETETAVAQALIDLENNVPDLKTELRVLQVSPLSGLTRTFARFAGCLVDLVYEHDANMNYFLISDLCGEGG